MKNQRECADRNEGNILSVLAKLLVVLLFLVVAIGCRSVEKRTPLRVESVIAQAETYQSLKERELFFKYKGNLEHIYQKVRDRYTPGEVEFYIVRGIYFISAKGVASPDKYLVVNIKMSELFHDSKTPFNKRTAQIFFEYIKPLFKIIAAEKELLDDPLVAGVALGVRWQVKKLLLFNYVGDVPEQIQLIVLKDNLDRYLKSEITDQQLLDWSSIILLHERKGNRKITITLE